MRPYKKLFSETIHGIEDESEAEQIVDISRLQWINSNGQWGPNVLPDNISYNLAVKETPPGFRLPTIQELYTASIKRVPGFFNSTYWSSDWMRMAGVWVYDFHNKQAMPSKTNDSSICVCYVREI
jgi:hypothetical protein